MGRHRLPAGRVRNELDLIFLSFENARIEHSFKTTMFNTKKCRFQFKNMIKNIYVSTNPME